MEWLCENWALLIAFICVGAVVGVYIYKFFELPTGRKMQLFRETLYQLVVKAEKEFGSGKGKEKLEYVYSAIKKQFPFITMFMDLDTFEVMVKGALIEVGIWLKK